MRTVSDDDDPAATSWLAGISPRGLGAVYCSALCQSVDLTENQHEAALRVSPLPALVDQWEPRLAARCLWTRVRGGQSDVDAALFDEMTAEASEVSDDASISAAACALEGFLPPGATASDFAEEPACDRSSHASRHVHANTTASSSRVTGELMRILQRRAPS